MVKRIDQLNLILMIAGLLLMIQPAWRAGFRVGFFVLIVSILVHNVVPRLIRH
jgi:hypothetical protein